MAALLIVHCAKWLCRYERHTWSILVNMDCTALPVQVGLSNFSTVQPVQVILCNITNTPITHYAVNCTFMTVLVILHSIIERLYPANESSLITENDLGEVNSSYYIFSSNYLSLFNKYFPYVRQSWKPLQDKLYITSGIKVSIRTRNRLYHKYLNDTST